MKIYTTTYQDIEDNTVVEWFGTQADHKKRNKELKAEGFVTKAKIVDFPLDKGNVIGFLNRYVTQGVGDLIDILPEYVSKGGSEQEAES